MARGVAGVCKWGCGQPVPKPALYWHKQCLEQFMLHTRADSQKAFLIDRDGPRCAMDGCGAVPRKWLHDIHGRREFADTRRFYKSDAAYLAQLWPSDPATGRRFFEMTAEEQAYGAHYRVWQVCALEVDHRVPLWKVANLPDDERRAYFGPPNLWLLCPACHKAKTKREATERSTVRFRAGYMRPMRAKTAQRVNLSLCRARR